MRAIFKMTSPNIARFCSVIDGNHHRSLFAYADVPVYVEASFFDACFNCFKP